MSLNRPRRCAPLTGWAALLCALSSPGWSQPQSMEKLWSGTWVMTEETTNDRYFACCDGPGKEVPLAPRFRKIRDDFAAIPFATQAKTVGNLPHCISPGTPGLMQHPLLFEFSWSPGRVNILYQDGSFRRVWTDGRAFPASMTPTFQGYSIGRWDKDTLVVETRSISPRSEMLLSAPINVTRKTRVTERFTVVEGHFKSRLTTANKLLRVNTTIEDHEVFTAPYTFDMEFIEVPVSFETGCAANNRDNGEQFDLTPPDDD